MIEEEGQIPEKDYDTIGLFLADIRREAIEGRKNSGIEAIWDEDEAHYHGIDEYNDDPTWNEKPPGQTGAHEKEIAVR